MQRNRQAGQSRKSKEDKNDIFLALFLVSLRTTAKEVVRQPQALHHKTKSFKASEATAF